MKCEGNNIPLFKHKDVEMKLPEESMVKESEPMFLSVNSIEINFSEDNKKGRSDIM